MDGFAARLSKRRRRHQPGRQRSFSSFGHFFVYYSFDDIIYSNDRQGLDSIRVVDQQFYSRRLFAALASTAMNFGASVIARIGRGRGI
jgi:hypothetical protein